MKRIAFATVGVVAISLGTAIGQESSVPIGIVASPENFQALPAAQATPVLQPADAVATAVPHEFVLIKSQVLEIDAGVDVNFGGVEYAFAAKPGMLIELLRPGSAERVVMKLVDSKQARILSAPRLMTLGGQAASVRVGSEVVVKDPDGKTETQPIGLNLECRPIISKDKLKVELKCDYSTLDEHKQINARSLETRVLMDWDKTLAVRGLDENILLLLSAERRSQGKVIQGKALRTGQIVYGTDASPARARFNQLPELYNIFGGSDTAKVERIDVGQDKLKITATVFKDQQSKIPSILAGISKLSPYKLTSVSQSPVQDGTQLVVECEKQTSGVANEPNEPLDDLGTALKKLFPSERIEITVLPSAVLLRGEAEPAVIDEAIEIAEQYYPTVINGIKGRDVASSTTQDTAPSIREHLDGLSTELRLLRSEVRELIDTLKAERRPSTKQSASSATFETPALTLTLEQTLDLAKQHHADADEADWNRFKQQVTQHFEKLHLLKSFDQKRAAAGEMIVADHLKADFRLAATPSKLTEIRNDESRQELEKRLKELLGLEDDPRRIDPLVTQRYIYAPGSQTSR